MVVVGVVKPDVLLSMHRRMAVVAKTPRLFGLNCMTRRGLVHVISMSYA